MVRPVWGRRRKLTQYAGATLAGTDTRFAERPKTGEIVWKHQVLPRDEWDQECTFEMMLINTGQGRIDEKSQLKWFSIARAGL
jgi:glucose dehydrogenase